jgi:hypothetical protein
VFGFAGDAPMNPDFGDYEGGYVAGDVVTVADGTFVGMRGTVLSRREAITLRERSGGGGDAVKAPAGFVWVELILFGRPCPVAFRASEIRRPQA